LTDSAAREERHVAKKTRLRRHGETLEYGRRPRRSGRRKIGAIRAVLASGLLTEERTAEARLAEQAWRKTRRANKQTT
jgi:hypothetical protein